MIKSNKGMAMLIVISLIIMLLILGGAVLMVSTGHFGTSFHQVSRTKAYYAAEAAMNHVLWALRTGRATAPGEIALPSDFDVNGITDSDITIIAGDLTADGVYPIDIDVTY